MIEYNRKVMFNVEVDSYGEIEVAVPGGYCGEEVTVSFTIEEMKRVVEEAEAHFAAYKIYADGGYEDEDAYHEAMKDFASDYHEAMKDFARD